MRLLFLFAVLMLSGVAAPAQSLPAAHPPDTLSLPPVAAAPLDSAAALHRLFVAKRNIRTVLVVGTVLTGGISLVMNGIFHPDNQSTLPYAASQTRTLGLTALLGTTEVVYFRQYSREKEQLAQLALAQHKLSPELKHHFKPRHFRDSGPSLAQVGSTSATLPPKQSLATSPAVAVDTAAALHRLFEQRRHRGHVKLKIGAGILGVSGIALAIAGTQAGWTAFGVAVVSLVGVVVSVPILVTGTVGTLGHTKGREQRVIQAWQQHRLPRRWARRALVPEYTQLQKQP